MLTRKEIEKEAKDLITTNIVKGLLQLPRKQAIFFHRLFGYVHKIREKDLYPAMDIIVRSIENNAI